MLPRLARAGYPGTFEYAFAVDWDKRARRVLAAAWRGHGLEPRHVYRRVEDVDLEALRRFQRPVDVLVITPCCRPFSKRNRRRSRVSQARAMHALKRALVVVREIRPRTVLVENVAEPAAMTLTSALLARVPGYRWERVVVCPTMLGWPMRRRRCIWRGFLL